MFKQIIGLFKPSQELPAPVATIAVEPIVVDFVSFPCVCGESVKVRTRLMPGEAAILSCDNCEVSWTVYSPSLIISQTKEVPDLLQKKVWGELST